MFGILILISTLGVALGQPKAHTVGNYTAQAQAARCTGTPVLTADNGVGDAGTLEACAARCEANRPTCEKFAFRGSQTNKCHYFGSDCDPVGNQGVTKGTAFSDAIYAHNDDINAVQLMDFYGDVVVDTRCESNGRITGDHGMGALRTLESCAKQCATTYKNECTGFTYRTSGSVGNPRCFYHHEGCRRYRVTANWDTGQGGFQSYWFKGDTLQHYAGSVPNTVRDRLKVGAFQAKEYAGPCFAKSITYGGESSRKAYAKARCSQNANFGVLYTSDFDYNQNNGDTWRRCADLCVAWNTNSSNTQECRAFNKIKSGDNAATFKCELIDCGPYPRPNPQNSINVFNPGDSNTPDDKWGFLDDATTPSCRGNFVDQHDQEIMNSYDAYSENVCVGTAISHTDFTTAIECATKCSTSNGNGKSCVAFSFRPKVNKCHTWSRCELDTATSQSVQDVVYLKKFYLDHVTGIRRDFLSVNPGETCAANPGAVLNRTLTPGVVNLDYCTKACYEDNAANCEFFEFDSTTCKIWADCGGSPGVDAAALGNLYEPVPVGQTLPPSPQITQAPTPTPECIASSDCTSISGQDICTKSSECERVECSSHEQCFGYVRFGKLPICDFKFGICTDFFNSNCNSVRRCRSQARKKWKRRRAFAKSRLKNEEARAEKRRQFTLEAIQDLEVAVNTSSSVYITVEGTEVVEIGSGTLGAVNDTDALYEAMVSSYCGDAVEECSYTITGGLPARRRALQDENVTIVITYEVDENLYQDLVNTGFDFDNSNFTQAVADELGIDVNLVEISGVNGTIEIEVSIVDEAPDGEPIGDSLIEDITTIQESLENITSTVIDEVGANATQIDVEELDLCGDRQCNNQGKCSSSTGICSCAPGYGGINCEEKSICGDEAADYCKFGGECRPDGLACHCVYPHYGFRCGETPVACGTCPGTGEPGEPVA